MRDALETQVHGLREALAREGIQVSRVEVSSSMNPQTSAGSPQQHAAGQQGPGPQADGQQPREEGGFAFAHGHAGSPETPVRKPFRPVQTHQGSLNLFV